MKKMFRLLFILSISLGSLSAQVFKSTVNPYPSRHCVILNSSDTLRILAVMVEFQEDRYDATVGNGKFGSVYTQDYQDNILDPLPHDSLYFSNHLEFAKNYFLKVSNGKVNIDFTVLPNVYTVSKTMREYSPPYNSDDLSSLGYFAEEVWHIVDSSSPNVDFSDYNLFMIFHAGVSRGLDFGTILLDRNLPSLYLGIEAFKNIFGNDFQGFPLTDAQKKITNTIIMSETESREFEYIDGSIVLQQLTINGLIVSNIASYLGLPDLFDTDTGVTVIGRFGLMDGAGIFANYGISPPEPSAWEKIYLGWETPAILQVENQQINISTRYAALPGDTTLVKVPINSFEYYLVENRSQDANEDNAIITYKIGDQAFQKVLLSDSAGYFSITPDSLRGVIVDIDEYDASVPGDGIVIWHIDENIINEKIAENKINTDKFKRGVDIEEADGIQDIGERFETIFGSFINDGSREDLWYSSNPSQLYQNRFSDDTKPNTRTNNGAKSLISFENFSNISNKMSFEVRFANTELQLLTMENLNINKPAQFLSSFNSIESNYYLILSGKDLYRYNVYGSLIDFYLDFTDKKPASAIFGGTEYIVGVNGSVVNVLIGNNSSQIVSQDIGVLITSPPVLRINSSNNLELLLGTMSGTVVSFNVNDIVAGEPIDFDPSWISSNTNVKQICADADYFSYLMDNSVSDVNNATVHFLYETVSAILTKDINNDYETAVLTSLNNFYIVKNGVIISEFNVNSQDQITSFSMVDLFEDGENYVLFTDGIKLEARNLNGRIAENFPIYDTQNIGFIGTPLIADINGDNRPEILVTTKDGRIFAFNVSNGDIIQSFPISCGSQFSGLTVSVYYDHTLGVFNEESLIIGSITTNNDFFVWKSRIGFGSFSWTEELGNNMNSSFIEAAKVNNLITDFFPKNKAYNWPNPVYGEETNIRYFVSEDAEVNIKIFDLAGDLVTHLSDHAVGGFDNETIWNVSNIQSGIYFAYLEVNGISGKKDSKIIKIAVVK